MREITLWHNPRCSKSRDAFKYVEEKALEMNVRKYLEETPSKEEIESLLVKLGCGARELMRTKESIYKELDLTHEDSEEKLIEAMVAHPKLIERPIVIKGDRAVIGRPFERVIALLG